MMADCLERSDGQAISREEFFVVHNKGSGIIGSSSLCIGSLGGASVIKCQDSLDALTEHDKIVKKQLSKADDVITSGFILLNQERCKSGAFKLSPKPVKSPTKNDISNPVLSCPVETPTSPDVSENLQPSVDPSVNLNSTNDQADQSLENTKSVQFEDDLNVFGSEQLQKVVILLNDDSNSSVDVNASDKSNNRNDFPIPSNEKPVSINSDIEAKEVVVNRGTEVSHSVLLDEITLSTEKDITATDCKQQDLISDIEGEEELPETSWDSSRVDDTEEVECLDEVESSGRASVSSTEDKSEVIDVKPDIIDMSMYEDDDHEDEQFPAGLESAAEAQLQDNWTDNDPENQIDATQFLAKDDSDGRKNLDVDNVESEDVKSESDEKSEAEVKNEANVKSEEEVKSEAEVKIEAEVKSKRHEVSTDVSQGEKTCCENTTENCGKKVCPSTKGSVATPLLRNSRCTIQLVPKGHGRLLGNRKRMLLESDEDWQQDSEKGLAQRLETLTGTVKIGCLSVTPLLPVSNKEKQNNQTNVERVELKPSAEEPTNNAVPLPQENTSAHNQSVSMFGKKEASPNSLVDLTVSPKPCESGIDALETLKVKIPQLIESFTGGGRPEKHSRHDPDKNLIVNKNLKIIESFLMEKGYKKEATILKEKTDIIKPYLEDIALRMEKSINDRRLGHVTQQPPIQHTRTLDENLRAMQSIPCDKTVEKELSALTEKFLNSSGARPRQTRRPEELTMLSEKIRMYDRYYGKPYYETLDYLMKRDGGTCAPTALDSKVYRSSRHQREDYGLTPPDVSLYDQFLPDFDNKMHPTTQVGKSNCFSQSDFSQFIDEYTADKYNNFIHFMVGNGDAQSFDIPSKTCKENEAEFDSSWSPTLNCCFPNTLPPTHLYPPSPFSYSQNPFPMGPVSPAIGRPLPMDNARETCGQLTITPLDQSGKPYGPVATPPEACSRGLCSESYQSFGRGMLPPVPPLLPNDTLSHQLTITPLQQTSNLPYLHRSAESALRRRGRPPMDPEYAAVGYRKDAYANVRFSRSDFMARVESNLEPPCPDRYQRTSRIPSDNGRIASGLHLDQKKFGPSLMGHKEPKLLTPPGGTQNTSKTQSPVLSGINMTNIPTPLMPMPLKEPTPKPPSISPPSVKPPLPVAPSVSSPNPSSVSSPVLPPNGYKRLEEKLDKVKPRFVEIAPKSAESKTKTLFQVTSKQVKINTEKLLSNSNIKISIVEKKATTEACSSKSPEVSIHKTNSKEDKVSTAQSATSSDSITKLQTVFKNTTITLKPAQGTSPKDPLPLPDKVKMVNTEEPQVTVAPETINKINKSCVEQVVEGEQANTKHVFSPTKDAALTQQDQVLNQPKPALIPAKPKKKRRIPHFRKKKKKLTNKSSGEVENKVLKTRKVVLEKPLLDESKTPDPPLCSPKNNRPQISNKTETNISEAKPTEIDSFENCELFDQSSDGVRRSGRKRKIIEGNPKFRDMERVDLKYFREDRTKTPTKRKADPKLLLKHECNNKKRSVSDKKTMPSKEQINSNKQSKTISTNSKHVDNVDNPNQDEERSNEKLQQFLDVNDIYLKPQTFI